MGPPNIQGGEKGFPPRNSNALTLTEVHGMGIGEGRGGRKEG